MHEIIHHLESLHVFYRDAKKLLFQQASDKSRSSFEGMSLRERRDKRESFIVRARLILHHRQSREPSGQQSLVGGRHAVTQVYPGGGKLCYGVYLQLGITCRINASPTRGISERRRHELRITACTPTRYARAQKQSPNVEFVRARDRGDHNTVPLKLNIPIKRIRETAI